MNPRTLRVLEYDVIIAQLLTYTACSLGKQIIERMAPFEDLKLAEAELAVVDESLQFVYRFGSLPYGGITDVSAPISKCEIGGVLSAIDILAVAEFIRGGRNVKVAIENAEESSTRPQLLDTASGLFDARQTEQELRLAISDEGTVLDGASDALRRLRHERRQSENRVRQILENMLRTHQKYLQDGVIAMRGNSFCLPVRVDYKNLLPGIIHDYSASGATVYIEPQSVVEANQKVRELILEEEREIERILQRLSGVIAGVAEPLLENIRHLGQLDAWFAKAAHAKAKRCERPQLTANHVWNLRSARHPLLDKQNAIPVDVTLGQPHGMIVITGPNTGGKTVTLKTIGLLTVLAMSGCFIHTGFPSEIGWCDNIYADIGDEQSIEQSLSTFSSHMRNIVQMLDVVTADSLVLLDELGAGTDPAEGAALAISILDALNDWGSTVIATTHYPELKGYAFGEPRAINASMEFDVESLRPTYRLLVGIPGRSNALAIASRLGLSAKVIHRAQRLMESQDVRYNDLIAQMEEARLIADTAKKQALVDLEAAKKLRQDVDAEKLRILAASDKEILTATLKAKSIIETAQAEANRVIAELRQRQIRGGGKDHELVNLRKALENALPGETHGQHATRTRKEDVRVGAVVKVLSLGQKGEVLELVSDGKEVLIQLGLLRTKVKLADIELLQNAAEPQRSVTVRRGMPAQIALQIDIRGELVEEAKPKIDKYLDDAVVNSIKRVTIIHGKGTGALRDGIRRFLSSHPHVETWQAGGAGEGGDGATVVTMYT